MKKIFRVLSQGEPQQVPSQKAENGQLSKCTIVLQEFGGRYEPSYVCTLMGNSALCKFTVGDLVFAALRFQAVEYQGKWFQDITVDGITNVSN